MSETEKWWVKGENKPINQREDDLEYEDEIDEEPRVNIHGTDQYINYIADNIERRNENIDRFRLNEINEIHRRIQEQLREPGRIAMRDAVDRNNNYLRDAWQRNRDSESNILNQIGIGFILLGGIIVAGILLILL